jgi:hypothetical protein
VDGRPPPKIRQRKSRSAVSSVSGAQDRKKCRVLGYGEQLAITKRPPSGRKISGKKPDFSDERVLGRNVPGQYVSACNNEKTNEDDQRFFHLLTPFYS